jgi:endonuclease-3 related protein
MIGAVLTQNTAWKNVAKSILLLKAGALVTPEAIVKAGEDELLEALRPSGYFRVKAERLLALCRMVLGRGKGGLRPQALSLPQGALREELLQVRGVGPETADCIVLYAAGYPSFVVDAYTKRLLSRHGLMEGEPSYEEIRLMFMENLPESVPLYNEFHALVVAAGHNFCARSKPRCDLCPLGSDPRLSLK